MDDDIVARLRVLTDTLRLGDFQGLAATTASAADEIERLRELSGDAGRLRAERDALVEQRGRWIAATQLHAARANQQPPEIRRHWDSADA